MISITQYDLRADVLRQFTLMHRFNSACRSHGHKNGGVDLSVIGCYGTRPGFALRVGVQEVEFQGNKDRILPSARYGEPHKKKSK
jgi:hypothetical protein